jgi:hypothetical protein
MNRLRAALRFNSPQIQGNIFMAVLILAGWGQSERPLWILPIFLSVCPCISLIANLIDPIKDNEL